MIEGIPRLSVLNERIAHAVQSKDWKLLVRTLVAIDTTEWEEPLEPSVFYILANGSAALNDMLDVIAWLNGTADATMVAEDIEHAAHCRWRNRKVRRQLLEIAKELRQAWRPWEGTT